MSLAPPQPTHDPNTRFTLADYYDRSSPEPQPEPEERLSDNNNHANFDQRARSGYGQTEGLGYGYPVAGPSRSGGSYPAPAAQTSTQNLLEPQQQYRSVSGQTLQLHDAFNGSPGHDDDFELNNGHPAYPPLPPQSAFQPMPSHQSYGGIHEDDEEKLRKTVTPDVQREVVDQRWRLWHRYIFPSSIACRLLLLTVLLETAIDIAIEADILWRFNQEVDSAASTDIELQNKRRLPVYLCIFGLAHLWQLILTMDAIRTRNTIQVIALAIFNGMFLIYAGIEISEIRTILGTTTPATGTDSNLLTLPLNILTSLTIAIIATSEVIVVILTWFIWREFGMKIYRFLGADLQIRKYYFHYQIFDCICRFSAFFFAAFGIQFIFLVLNKTDPEYIVTCIMLPLTLVFLLIGILAARYENKWVMALFEFTLVAGCAYFTFKLVRIWQFRTTTYKLVEKSLTAFAALSIVMLVMCFIAGLIVWSNFGKGLKQHVIVHKDQDEDVALKTNLAYNQSQKAAHRLTID